MKDLRLFKMINLSIYQTKISKILRFCLLFQFAFIKIEIRIFIRVKFRIDLD